MSRLRNTILPVVSLAAVVVTQVFDQIPDWVGYAAIGVAAIAILYGVGVEARKRWRKGRKLPEAVAMDIERMGGMLEAFLNEQARKGPPAEFVGETPDIYDPHEMRHVAYVRAVVPAYERDIKPQILKHYEQARKLRFRDSLLEGLLATDIVRIQQLWEISVRLCKLAQQMKAAR